MCVARSQRLAQALAGLGSDLLRARVGESLRAPGIASPASSAPDPQGQELMDLGATAPPSQRTALLPVARVLCDPHEKSRKRA